MNPYLEVWPRSGVRERVELPTGTLITMGRAEGNDIEIADELASRLHAVLEWLGVNWSVRDVGSRNGTFVNGARIARQMRLADSDEIRIGRTRIVMHAPFIESDVEVTQMELAPPRLTPREQDVLYELLRPSTETDAFSELATPREIASKLWVTEAAVKHHLSNLYDKFGIDGDGERRRTRLANEALRRGAVNIAEIRAKSN